MGYARWFVHNFEFIFPIEKYYGEHPEYYSLVNGTRVKDYPQLCLTNPDVLRIMIEAAKKTLRDYPNARIITLTQNDWGNHCDCDECRAIDEREGARSGSLIEFINKVAEAIEPEFPDVTVDTLAYQQTRPAPKYIRPRHNVCVRLCTIENCFMHTFEKCEYQARKVTLADGTQASFNKDLKDWAKVCDRLYIWNYVTNFSHYAMPYPNWNALQPDVKFLVANNVKGLFQQGTFSRGDGLDLNEMRAYIIVKILWDPETDVEYHMKDFADFFYGPAAEHILTYVRTMTDIVEKENIHMGCFENCDKPYLTDEWLDRYDAMLEKAAEAVAGDVIRSYRIFRAKMPLRYVRLKNDSMNGKIDKPAIDQFFNDLLALNVSRIEEWVALEKSRRAMYEGQWRGSSYLENFWDEGGGEPDYMSL
jgi:hypothetical protein